MNKVRAKAKPGDFVGGVIEKSTHQRLKVSLRSFAGVRHVDLRVWLVAGSGDVVPSPKGVTFSPQLLDDIFRALRRVRERARAEGLIK